MRSRSVAALRRFAAVSVAGLVLSVLGVAVVAIVAESYATWEWYFRMEQAMSLLMPVTMAFLGLSLVSGFGVVYAADRR
ncbi:hypothetical protein [Haloprofundus halophilus]|uniref:hypothetical protein n=1 Tax=Haloprofundus halophilus TaxID=2283527 RepID=UPI000E43033D|nr:hypothetical protein [Haloprofundus halophilus]